MSKGRIEIAWSAPLDVRVYGYGPRIDPGGFVYRIFNGDGRKIISGSASQSGRDIARVEARVRGYAAEKGLDDVTVSILSLPPS
jgi:hypothetical protein